MEFKRNEAFDDLILKIKKDKSILKKLNYEELELFTEYLVELYAYLKG